MISLFNTVLRSTAFGIFKMLPLSNSSSVTSRCLHHMCARQNLQTISDTSLNDKLLQTTSPLYNMVCGMKVKGRIKRRCRDCYFVMRQGRLFVMCKTHPRHKQASIVPKEYKTWILTHATQHPLRPW